MYPNHEARIGRIITLSALAVTSLAALTLKAYDSDFKRCAESLRSIKGGAEANNPISAIRKSISTDDQSNATDANTLGALVSNPRNRELRASSLAALQSFVAKATNDSLVLAEFQQDIARDRLEFAIKTATQLQDLLESDSQPATSKPLFSHLIASLEDQYMRYVEATQGR